MFHVKHMDSKYPYVHRNDLYRLACGQPPSPKGEGYYSFT